MAGLSIAQTRGVVDQQPGGFHVGRHFSQSELHALKFRYCLAELVALFRVLNGVSESAPARPTIWPPIAIRPSFRVSMAIL